MMRARAETLKETGIGLKSKLKSLLRKKNKITLFFPSSNPGNSPPIPNLGIGYIGTVLHQHGHPVHCIDGNLISPGISTEQSHLAETVLKESIEAIEKTEPDILGVGSWTTNFPLAAELITEFARRFPGKLIVLGGYQATFLPRFVLEFLPQVDILVRGEGEYTMLDLVQTLQRGGRLEDVKGIMYRQGNQIVETPGRELIRDLNQLPFINYSLFAGFASHASPCLRILTARGCPFRCVFCSCKAFWHKIRMRSVENIISEIKYLRDTHGVRAFGICDDLFAVSENRVLQFCKRLRQEQLEISWSFNARIDTLSPSVAEVALQSGATSIKFGMESTSIKTLKFIDKGKPAEYLRKAEEWIEYCLSHNVPCNVSTIVGFPNETKADIENTLKLVRRFVDKGLKMYTGLLICYPGTALWGMYERGEIKLIKIRNKILRRNSSGFFAGKYEHLPECVPNAWMVRNEHLSGPMVEQLLLNWIGAVA